MPHTEIAFIYKRVLVNKYGPCLEDYKHAEDKHAKDKHTGAKHANEGLILNSCTGTLGGLL